MFSSIEDALIDLKLGKPIIVVDDEERENEGDFIALSSEITPEVINLMITKGRGLVCVSVTQEIANQLSLKPMVKNNTDPYGTAFTESIDFETTTTGISAYERAETVSAMIKPDVSPAQFKRPGHIFPLIAKEGGVLTREGHTEAAVDLAKLCKKAESAVICEIIKEDGHMARLPELKELALSLNLKIITIKDLVAYRMYKDYSLTREVVTNLPTQFGDFKVYSYSNTKDNLEHLALVKGDVTNKNVHVRIHSECLTGDVFHSKRCDCGAQLEAALSDIEALGQGVLLYMRQEGRGIGLINKLKAYSLQDKGLDTVEANEALGFASDLREYDLAAKILQDLKINEVILLTNNPLKIKGLEANNIKVNKRISIQVGAEKENQLYLQTKKEKLGHLLI